jgi:carboxypeptidase family protein
MLGQRVTRRHHSISCFIGLVLSIAALFASANAAAQSVGANVGGVVSDPSGARLPGVTVTVTNKANGATQTFVTGPEGNYRAVALQPGPCRGSPPRAGR